MTVSAGPQIPLSPLKLQPIYLSLSPRCVVKIDGNPYIPESYSVTTNAHGATDQATVTMPIDGYSNLPAIPGSNSPYPDWTDSIQRSLEAGNATTPVVVEIWAGFPPDLSAFNPHNLAGLTVCFRGIVDQYSPILEDNKTTFECRSLAAPLTSTKIVTPFPDEESTTTVAFIQQQAARFGIAMASPVLAQPPVKMIDVLGSEFMTGVRGWYIWDLMLQCAQMDNCDIWVDKTGTLNYAVASLLERSKVYYTWGKNCKGIAGTHSPQFSKNIRVYVHSWKTRTRTTSVVRAQSAPDGTLQINQYSRVVNSTPIFGTTESLTTTINSNGTVSTSMSEGSGGGASGSTGTQSELKYERYDFWPRNKTLAQCLDLAQKLWSQYSMHEYSIKLRAPVTPADLAVMDVTATIVLDGHPMTWFNSIVQRDPGMSPLYLTGGYYPRQIVEEFDPKTGWFWDISAVNHPLPQGAV